MKARIIIALLALLFVLGCASEISETTDDVVDDTGMDDTTDDMDDEVMVDEEFDDGLDEALKDLEDLG